MITKSAKFKLLIHATFALASISIFLGQPAWAMYSTVDTADVVPINNYSLGLEPQYIFNNFPGANVIAHLDMGATDSSNMKFVLGSGSTVFQGGAFYKLIPIPDFENQPGIGFFAGILYTDYSNGTTGLHMRVHPLISKQFNSDVGKFTPYFSLPFGVSFWSGSTTYPVQIVFGSRWLPSGLKHTNFLLEAGFEANKAFSYISAMVSVPFESFDKIRLD